MGVPKLLTSQRLTIRSSEIRAKLNDLANTDALADEQRADMDALTAEYRDVESKLRAALIAEAADVETHQHNGPDAEHRERVELRSRASLTNYILTASQGRLPSGAEAELNAAAGIDGGIPLELWDTGDRREQRQDVQTDAPGTVGVNLDRIRPAVFANAVLPRLGVEMPRVMSGTYASATIGTSLTAAPQAQGAEFHSTAATFNVTTATPKRITGRLAVQIEDIAAVGQENFESILRENLSLVLSNELDNQGLNGTGVAPNLTGLFQRLTDPSAPTGVVDFDGFAATHAAGVDGLWAATIMDVSILVGPTTYQLASRTFQTAANYKGEMSASAYAMRNTGGFMTNARMPDAASNIQQAILYRKARSFMNMGEGYMRTAVCPHWNMISIDDIYSGSAKGERYFTMHVLLGDVIVVQPDAYRQVSFQLA